MILPEHENLAGFFSKRKTVCEEAEFNGYRVVRLYFMVGHRNRIPRAAPTVIIDARWNSAWPSPVAKPLTDSTITTKLTEPIL
jgi:hypothetical protein